MPQTMLVCPKGGATGVVCKCYGHLQKIQLVEECVLLRLEHNLSLCRAARALIVPHSLLINPKSTLPALKVVYGKSHHSAYIGHVGQLDPVKKELLAWIFARCEQGIAVTKSQAVSLGCELFLGQHGYIYCLKTNKATRPRHKVYTKASGFLATTRLLLVGPHRNKRNIWNMDQTNFPINVQKP
jgi:hypothetical protein